MPLSVSSATPNKPCHVERSEASHALVARCFAALNMTDGCSPFYAPQRRTYMKVWKVCALAGAHKLSTFSRNRLASEPGQVKKHLLRSPTFLGHHISSCIKLC